MAGERLVSAVRGLLFDILPFLSSKPPLSLCVYLLALSIQRLIVDLLLGPMLKIQVWIGLGGGFVAWAIETLELWYCQQV